jgi:hypothetical protein
MEPSMLDFFPRLVRMVPTCRIHCYGMLKISKHIYHQLRKMRTMRVCSTVSTTIIRSRIRIRTSAWVKFQLLARPHSLKGCVLDFIFAIYVMLMLRLQPINKCNYAIKNTQLPETDGFKLYIIQTRHRKLCHLNYFIEFVIYKATYVQRKVSWKFGDSSHRVA